MCFLSGGTCIVVTFMLALYASDLGSDYIESHFFSPFLGWCHQIYFLYVGFVCKLPYSNHWLYILNLSVLLVFFAEHMCKRLPRSMCVPYSGFSITTSTVSSHGAGTTHITMHPTCQIWRILAGWSLRLTKECHSCHSSSCWVYCQLPAGIAYQKHIRYE